MPLYPITVPNVPSAALEALERVQSVDQHAILAGGVLRDSLFGKEVKDVDIFTGPFIALCELRAAFPNHYVNVEFDVDHMRLRNEYGMGFGERVDMVYKVTHGWDGSLPIQIIVRRDPIILDEVLADFDWSFCQIGKWNGANNGICYGTHAFRLSMNDGPIFNTLPLGDTRVPHSLERGRRLSLKYPERTFYQPIDHRKMVMDLYQG